MILLQSLKYEWSIHLSILLSMMENWKGFFDMKNLSQIKNSLIRLVYLFVWMLRRLWKRKEEEEYASGGNNPPKRLSYRTDDSEVAEHVTVCEVFKNGKVSVRNFGGKIMMDSRVLFLFACAEMLRRLRERKRVSMLLEATILLRDYPPEPMILKLPITS